MNQPEPRVLSTLTQLLRSAFIKSDFALGMTPAFSPVAEPAAGAYKWYCLGFDGLEEFRLFAGTIARSDESAQAAHAETAKRLTATFTIFADLLSTAAGQKFAISELEEMATAPGDLQIVLQAQGIGTDDGLLLALDTPAIAWFVANLPALQREGPVRSSMMDTLMDVELPVSILLASREASLNDVLQWGPGVIVEFEAGLGDPVDVIVNKQTVARGSVVLVDGNYGVRVTEVLPGSRAISAA